MEIQLGLLKNKNTKIMSLSMLEPPPPAESLGASGGDGGVPEALQDQPE